MIRIAKKCIQHFYQEGFQYHKAGIILLDLVPNTYQQLDWLTSNSSKHNTLIIYLHQKSIYLLGSFF